MSKYQELAYDVISHAPSEGIFYAFSDKQFEEGMKQCGYTQTDIDSGRIVKDGYGGFGTREAFDKRNNFYKEIQERIKKECTPEEIFEMEFGNRECGYTGNWSEALEVVREYFPDYTPTKELIKKCFKAYEDANC